MPTGVWTVEARLTVFHKGIRLEAMHTMTLQRFVCVALSLSPGAELKKNGLMWRGIFFFFKTAWPSGYGIVVDDCFQPSLTVRIGSKKLGNIEFRKNSLGVRWMFLKRLPPLKRGQALNQDRGCLWGVSGIQQTLPTGRCQGLSLSWEEPPGAITVQSPRDMPPSPPMLPLSLQRPSCGGTWLLLELT